MPAVPQQIYQIGCGAPPGALGVTGMKKPVALGHRDDRVIGNGIKVICQAVPAREQAGCFLRKSDGVGCGHIPEKFLKAKSQSGLTFASMPQDYDQSGMVN